MPATPNPLKLRRQRRIAWYILFAMLFFDVVLAYAGVKGAGSITLLIFVMLLYVAQLGSRIRRAESELAPPINEDAKLPPYWKILTGNLLFAGTFVLLLCSTSAMMGGLAALVVIGVLLPMAVSAKSRGLRRQRWTRFLIYAVAVSAGMVLDHLASAQEQRDFDGIIAAVEQYRAAEQHFPDTLEQLVPQRLAKVPNARFGKFMYSSDSHDEANLSHMPMPFIHESYNFKSKVRRTWD